MLKRTVNFARITPGSSLDINFHDSAFVGSNGNKDRISARRLCGDDRVSFSFCIERIYGCSNWRWWLNNTMLTFGMQNVTDEDPPSVAGSFENGYDELLTTIKGRFWYVGIKKRF